MTEREKSELILLLKEFKDVFAWDYSEMLGLDPGLVIHTLNVDPEAKPVAQPARVFHIEIEGKIVREVQKLLAAGFIKPIQHLRWLSNIVPVKKKNDQIRCCVDFRNFNKACPKDEFPLPNMDLLIDLRQEVPCFRSWMVSADIIRSEWHQRMWRKLLSEHPCATSTTL